MKKKLAIIVFSTVLLTGCGSSMESPNVTIETIQESENQTETEAAKETDGTTEAENAETEKLVQVSDDLYEQNYTADDGNMLLFVYYQGPKVVVKDNPAATEKITAELEQVRDTFQKTEEEYLGYAKEDYEYRMSSDYYYSLAHYYETTRNDNKVLSLKLRDVSYTGGAHGSDVLFGANFDAVTGEKLTMENIAEDPEALKTACTDEIIRQCGEFAPETFFDDVNSASFRESVEAIVNGSAWYFTASGIKLIANQYDIAPYAAGTFEFTVPYELLTGLKEAYQYQGGYLREVTSGSSVSTDLDGDGSEDKVLVSTEFNYDAGEAKVTLTVNDTDFSQVFKDNNIWFSDGLCSSYAVTDINEDDSYKEICIMDQGPSDDPVTYFFRYDGNSVALMGYINALVTSSDSEVLGGNRVLATLRISILETAYTMAAYQITEAGKIELIPQSWYEIIQYSGETTEHVHQILQDVTVYSSNDKNSQTVVLTVADGPVTFPRTDNAHWVEVNTADGSIYYLYLEDFSTIASQDKQLMVTDVFDNVFLAD